MKTHKEFLLDTLLHYSQNADLRSSEGNKCLYLMDNGNKCAIGRFITEGNHEKCEKQTIQWIKGQGFIPEIEHLQTGFLGGVQLFHDHSTNWNKSHANGLTHKGVLEFLDLLKLAEELDTNNKE